MSRLLAAGSDGPLKNLTAREGEVLQLIAEGRSNQGIADELTITQRSAEKYVLSIFTKLGLPDTGDRAPARARGADVPRSVDLGGQPHPGDPGRPRPCGLA